MNPDIIHSRDKRIKTRRVQVRMHVADLPVRFELNCAEACFEAGLCRDVFGLDYDRFGFGFAPGEAKANKEKPDQGILFAAAISASDKRI